MPMDAAFDYTRRFADWLQRSKPGIKKRGKHAPVIGLLCLSAASVVYFAVAGEFKNLFSPETLRPVLAFAILFGLGGYIIVGNAGLVFLKMVLCLGVMAWIIGWMTWQPPSVIGIVGQLAGWGLTFAWVWSLEPTETKRQAGNAHAHE